MIADLARPAVARLVRSPRSWVFVGAWAVLALALAASAHAEALPHGADRVLLDAYGAVVLPLLAFGVVAALVGSRSLAASIAPLRVFGAPPLLVATAMVAVALTTVAVLGGLLAAIVAVVAHGSSDPPVAFDALTSAYAGALGGASYAALFCLGASLGRNGGGRALFLVLDWALGAAGGVASLITPRAHLRNLLGGAGPAELSGGESGGVLVGLTAVYVGIVLWRARR